MLFDFSTIPHADFFVVLDSDNQSEQYQVPVSRKVQTALIEMLLSTRTALGLTNAQEPLDSFELSQKYGSEEKLTAKLDEPHFSEIKALWDLTNIPLNARAIGRIDALNYYFVVFRDGSGNRLLAVRRATHFKGIIKAHMRIVALVDDTLTLDSRPLFKLDNDFDYFVSDGTLFILRPSGLEYTAAVSERIMAAVADTVAEVSAAIPFIGFARLESYVRTHRNAARLVAALRSRGDLARITKPKLVQQCRHCRVKLETDDSGRLIPIAGHELSFLQVLDRRRYTASLIPRTQELYEAPNRRSVQN